MRVPRILSLHQVPYNMERIFWLLSGSDSQTTRALMEQFEKTQSLHLPKDLHSKVGNWPHPMGVGHPCNLHGHWSDL